MALPQTPEQWDAAAKAILEYPAKAEAEVKRLLGNWISELEPCTVYDRMGFLLGLTNKDRPVGRDIFPEPTNHIVLRAWRQ